MPADSDLYLLLPFVKRNENPLSLHVPIVTPVLLVPVVLAVERHLDDPPVHRTGLVPSPQPQAGRHLPRVQQQAGSQGRRTSQSGNDDDNVAVGLPLRSDGGIRGSRSPLARFHQAMKSWISPVVTEADRGKTTFVGDLTPFNSDEVRNLRGVVCYELKRTVCRETSFITPDEPERE